MQALTVVKALDVLEDRLFRFCPILELPMPDQFVLERTKKALHWRIVVAVALPTQTEDHATIGQYGLIETSRVLFALITMMQQARRRTALPIGHQPGLDDDRGALSRTHGPAHHAAGIQIEQDGDREPAGSSRHERQVARPHPVLCRHGKLLRQAIRYGRDGMAGLDRPDIPASP